MSTAIKWHTLGQLHCIGVDNNNTNIGARNSIKSRVSAINHSIYFVGVSMPHYS